MKLTVGSHRLRGTDGRVTVRGKSQIALEWGHQDLELQLTMNLYGSDGAHVARLRRNHWTFNDRDRFEFTGSSSGFHLVDTKFGLVVLRARVVGRDAVVITQGAFFSSAGDGIEVTTEDWSSPTAPAPQDPPRSRLTNPYYGADEVIAISKAVVSSAGLGRMSPLRVPPDSRTARGHCRGRPLPGVMHDLPTEPRRVRSDVNLP